MKKKVVVLVLLFALISPMCSFTSASAAHTHNYALINGGSQVINTPHEFWYKYSNGTQVYMRCAASETHWTAVYKCTTCGSTYNESGTTYSHPSPYCSSH
ncbi:MAG: hypothetical protein K0S61_2913 [Anaerocolumna sp.]|jgi:hypothetical protein|nr:hypothetical protein [Anaerocolumna sp.]